MAFVNYLQPHYNMQTLFKKSLFILYCCVFYAAVLLSGYLGNIWQFFIIANLCFFCGIYLLNNNPFTNKIIGYVLLGIYPFLLLIAFISSFFSLGFAGYPLVAIIAIEIPIIIRIYKKPKKTILKYSSVFIILLCVITATLPDYYNYRYQETNINSDKKLPLLELYNSRNEPVVFNKNKIIVLDIWTSSCGICIKQFPKFEALKNELKNDTLIQFYSLNLPLKRDVRKKISKYTQPYSFDKLYAGNEVQNQLKINFVPKYIIIDKNSNIRYIGSLNTGTFEFYKNFYTIINELKMKILNKVVLLCLTLIMYSCKKTENFASIKIEHKEINFGTISSKDTVTKIFKLYNSSDVPLKISKVGTSCGCTGAILSDSIIKTGDFAEIQATFIPRPGEAGVVKNSIVVRSNTSPSFTTLYLKGNVE